MPKYLYFYSADDFVSKLPAENASGEMTGKYPATLRLKATAVPKIIAINDTDSHPDLFDEVTTGQSIVDPVTIGGTTYAAGTKIQGAYTLYAHSDLSGFSVTTFRFGDDGYDYGVVQGVVSTAQMVPGGTYVFQSGQTTFHHEEGYLPCFVAGTMIETGAAQVPVQLLQVGDAVRTLDHGLCRIRWRGHRHVTAAQLAARPQLRPIRIVAGALGAGSPAADLLVSPHHRVLVRSRVAERMFGAPEVLVAAKHLVGMAGITIAVDVTSVDYFHLMFDRHEIVFSNGAETESLYAGPGALQGFGAGAREELFTLFPDLRIRAFPQPAARQLATGHEARRLALRHVQNGRALIWDPAHPN